MADRVRLSEIVFDAGTQIRASINEATVSAYAERMTEGDQFPPIVLFHDGNRYYLADGFHRALAAQRLQFADFDADVRPGTTQDALWFALGANKANGQRLTEADKKHAVLIALKTWKDYSAGRIAAQVGCSQDYVSHLRTQVAKTFDLPDRVVGKDGKTYNATPSAGRRHPQHDAVMAALKDGEPVHAIATNLHMGVRTVSAIRDAAGLSTGPDKSKAAVAQRRKDIRDMAERGFSSRQIADAVGLDEATVRITARANGVVIHADRVVGHIKRHDSNRIISQIVADAENLTEGADLIDFDEIDRSQLASWLTSLQVSRDKLGGFIRRLTKEQRDGEAA